MFRCSDKPKQVGLQAKDHSHWGVLFSDSTQSGINNFNESWQITISFYETVSEWKKISYVDFGKVFILIFSLINGEKTV